MLQACADAMREEYVAIIDAGLGLQLDDPAIAENWDQINPAPSVEDYQRFTMARVDALNYAIRGLPSDRIRFHLCWGSWHGPHTTDLPMADVVELMLAVHAGAYSFEAANARHEHEWKVWRDVKLPGRARSSCPASSATPPTSSSTPSWSPTGSPGSPRSVGRENVIASTDCGLGGRVHPQIAWAKLDTLAAGRGARQRPALGVAGVLAANRTR